MQIEAGKSYRAINGERVGPMVVWKGYYEDATGGPLFMISDEDDQYWCQDGTNGEPHTDPRPELNLVAEWSEGPTRTVTRREVNPGTYGPLRVLGTTQLPDTSSPAPRYTPAVDIELTETTLDADQLAVLVAHLQEIIGALREETY